MDIQEKIALLSDAQKSQLLEMIDLWLNGENPAIPPLIPQHRLYPIKAQYNVKDIKNIVAMFSKNKKWTCADLENEAIFPPNLKVRMQLINYKLYVMPRPTSTHQEILTNVSTYLNLFVKQNKLGKVYVAPFGVHIDEGTCLEPDIVLVLKPQLDQVDEKGIYTPPALVVEVISKSNYKKLREAKKQEYANFGIPEYWEIYPKKQKINVEILAEDEAGNKGYQLYSSAKKTGKVKSKVIEGFELSIEDTFDIE